MKGWRIFKQTRWCVERLFGLDENGPVPLHVAPRSCETASIKALDFTRTGCRCKHNSYNMLVRYHQA